MEEHADGFLRFINGSPTTFHAVTHYANRLRNHGFTHLSEREDWTEKVSAGGKYYLTRNSSSIVAFVVGTRYQAADPIVMIGTHIDAITMKVKPVSRQTRVGFEQLKVAPYAGPGITWWDRDLALGGRVMVSDAGKVHQRLFRSSRPFAKIPSLAEHFGRAAEPPFDRETQMTPIIGCCDNQSRDGQEEIPINNPSLNHSARLLSFIAQELGIDVAHIKDIECELFDHQRKTSANMTRHA